MAKTKASLGPGGTFEAEGDDAAVRDSFKGWIKSQYEMKIEEVKAMRSELCAQRAPFNVRISECDRLIKRLNERLDKAKDTA